MPAWKKEESPTKVINFWPVAFLIPWAIPTEEPIQDK